MAKYQIDYSYDIPEWGTVDLHMADSLDKAEIEEFAINELKELYPDIKNIEITAVRDN